MQAHTHTVLEAAECNPYLRVAMIQPFVMEGDELRIAYDHRLFLILEGEGELVLRDERHALRPNSLMCFPPGVEYCFVGKMKVIVFNFDVTRARTDRPQPMMPLPRYLYREDMVFDPTKVQGLEHLVLLYADEEMRERIEEITHRYLQGDSVRDAFCSAALKLLLVQILLTQSERHKDAQTLLAERIQSYLRTNAAELKGNGELAEIFGYHPIYLASLYKQKMGKTLHQALLEEKLRLAEQWLLLTNRSVEEIALEAGFSSHNHFCTAFKKRYGTSPLNYRARRNQIIEE